jgi:hypothetical protein
MAWIHGQTRRRLKTFREVTNLPMIEETVFSTFFLLTPAFCFGPPSAVLIKYRREDATPQLQGQQALVIRRGYFVAQSVAAVDFDSRLDYIGIFSGTLDQNSDSENNPRDRKSL